MWMSPGDIAASYRDAKSKKEIIEILMQLNECSRDDINKILKEYGYIEDPEKTSDKPKKAADGRPKKARKKPKPIIIEKAERKEINMKEWTTMEDGSKKPSEDARLNNTITIPETVWAGIVERKADLMEKVNEKAKELERMERNLELLELELKDHIKFLEMLEREGGVIGQ